MEEKEYSRKLLLNLKEVLGNNIIGLYQIGSACLEDYKIGKSDIDMVGVLSQPISNQQREALAKSIDHSHLPCPAKGLDIVLFHKDSLTTILDEPIFEFWFATGGSWRQEGWEKGQNKEMLIFIELSRRHGITLFGDKPGTYFTHIDRRLLVNAFLEMLQWHQTQILDPFHDPDGQNSVLNACRVFAFAQTGQFFSKTRGGEWMLQKETDNEIVRKALATRNGQTVGKVSGNEISLLLSRIINALKDI